MRYLALDLGERRIGVAVGEILAHPLTTLKRRSRVQDFAAIAELIRRREVDVVVVGLPLNMDGSSGFQAQRTLGYVERMKAALSEMGVAVDVVLWDERLSTEHADALMAESGHSVERRQGQIDAAAAAVILQSYLDRES
ncbi:MAG: Holliday junction resolvase RuvX [Anaerolineae bacterium]|nr:Holliday junction resolvase RuvX [Anaerolineae bacterium]